jgi:ABC-type transport system involved in multi-copper enzyme maturation permease subunit
MRLEFKRVWRGRRFVSVLVLAIAPILILSLPALFLNTISSVRGGAPRYALPIGYTEFFQVLWLHLAIFFSCASVFSQLFRSEVQEKTLHYYYMAPIRREMVVLAKYLAGLSLAATLFLSTSIATYYLYFSTTPAGRGWAFGRVGTQHLGNYLFIVLLACIAYGALFMLIGLVFRNPMIPAVFVLLLESFGYVLPPFFQRMTIGLYLQRFEPLTVAHGPFAIMIEPPSALTSVGVLLVVSAALVWLSTVILRRTQITYSVD